MTADAKLLADELERLDKLASEGPWFCGHGEGDAGLTLVDDGRTADNALFSFELEAHDANLLVALRNAVPQILKALRGEEIPAYVHGDPSSYPVGDTPVDVERLRQGNADLATENLRLREALRFYAHGDHWICEGSSQHESENGRAD